MSNAVKNFSVEYNPINKSNTFTSGDYVAGNIRLELSDDCKINSLYVKLKGKAKVKWTESYGKTVVVYHAKEKYFSLKESIIQEGLGSGNVGQGCHVYPFSFQIPAQDLPPSFHGSSGKIRYTLKAYLSRPMRMDTKAQAQLTFVSKTNLNSTPEMTISQHGKKDKKMNLFTSGTVAMDVNVDRMGFYPGEGIKVVAFIDNRSSREIKPKYCIYRKHSFFAKKKRKVDTKDLLKEVGEPIPPLASQTVTKIITIPPTACASVLNCNIIKAEYRLRVYLDVKFDLDPHIKFPIIILPASDVPDEQQLPAHPGFGFEAFRNPDLPGWTSSLQNPTASGPSAPPLSYEAYGLYPTLPGYNDKSELLK